MISGEERNDPCLCPYCDAEMETPSSICQPCAVAFVLCGSCGARIGEGLEVCPACGSSQAGQTAEEEGS